MKKRILIFGATGRTGKHVLSIALDQGYKITCLARNSKRIETRDNLTVLEGDPSDKDDVRRAVKDCDFVINVLNVSRVNDFPWAPLRTPKNYLSTVMYQLLPIAEEFQIRQIVLCSAWGVGDSIHDIPNWFRWFIDHSNIRFAYEDHDRQERLLMQSKLNWTIVRPVGLTNSSQKQSIKEFFGDNPRPDLTISRKSLASYLVNCVNTENLIKRKVVISKG